MKREFNIWLCWLFGGHIWMFNEYMNGKRDRLECKCGLGWYEKHTTDWRWF